MKKLIAILITATLLTLNVSAEEFETSVAATDSPIENTVDIREAAIDNTAAPYKTMADLYQAWYADYNDGCPYPDYVCGVWTDTGGMDVLTVATTKDEAGISGQEEILALIEDDNSVKFTYQSYPACELWALQDEIFAEMGGESPIISSGIDEMNNVVSVGIKRDSPDAEKTAMYLLEKYLDKIVIEYSDGFILDCNTAGIIDTADGGVLTTGAETGYYDAHLIMTDPDYTLLWITAAAILVTILAVSAVIIINRRKVLQTNTANSIECSKLSVKQTADIIKNNTPTPDNAVYDKIVKKISKDE